MKEIIMIKDTYTDMLDYLLDLGTYYNILMVKYDNEINNIFMNKKYSYETRQKKVENAEKNHQYWKEKSDKIYKVINDVKNNKIKSIEFL